MHSAYGPKVIKDSSRAVVQSGVISSEPVKVMSVLRWSTPYTVEVLMWGGLGDTTGPGWFKLGGLPQAGCSLGTRSGSGVVGRGVRLRVKLGSGFRWEEGTQGEGVGPKAALYTPSWASNSFSTGRAHC